jgi:orotate phosphoribosyltransferase-like protein
MDMRPILLPQHELQTRKARALKARGLAADDIAAAMGLPKDQVGELLGERKPAASAQPVAAPAKRAPARRAGP